MQNPEQTAGSLNPEYVNAAGAFIIMRIETRLAKKPDKKTFIQLALERDSDLSDVENCYPVYRKSIGDPRY